MDLGVKGKVALVCASSHGLGFATAARLAREGASVVVTGRDADAVGAAVKEIGGNALGIAVDLSKPEERQRLVAETQSKFGAIEIALMNTGIFESLSLEQWQGAFHSLVEPVVHLSQLILPGMVEKKWGRILAVTSFVARQPADLMSLSNSLRSAVNGVTKTLANEYGRHGITVNSILPGYILTDRMREVAKSQAEAKGLPADGAFDAIAANIPLGRLGNPAEFGDLAAFLLSDLASYVTGQAITIDGGLSKGVY